MTFHFETVKDVSFYHLIENCDSCYEKGSVRVYPSGCILQKHFKQYAMEIKKFKVYPDDIWVISYPKSGTTWTQEMVWLIENNLDFVTARRTLQRDRFPFFEVKCALLRDQKTLHPLQMIDCLKRPRFIKSHLPVDLLPAQLWTVKPKIIYVVRNPKDVAISYYYHHRLMHGYRGNIKTFVEIFLSGNVAYGPYWRHVLDFWKLRDEPNVLINSFEDMKKDICSVINKMTCFLGRTLNEDQVTALAQYLSFESMKKNSSVNFHNTGPDNEVIDFIRKGEVGQAHDELEPDLIERFDAWSKRHLRDTDYHGSL
ncbi:luciferin sulfotransferase-like [Schistocerca nitens]|uniref:luciferin sulfotransferase-like n=1 Tax=Schistocerca nitens TaxID=7011 RepID=UPI002119854A|nr:luciferin sulfotransferase-like [Schistocerca nitens]